MVGLLMGAHPAWAHVTVAPRESRPGISERYTVRVPTEGKVATVEVELEIPEGITISPQASTGWTHTLKRTGDRATSIVWTTDIKPGEFAEFGFIGRNPKTGESIVWKAHQRYADGTASHWVGEAGTRSPAPITTLAALKAQPPITRAQVREIDPADGAVAREFAVNTSYDLRDLMFDGTTSWAAAPRDTSGAGGPILIQFDGNGNVLSTLNAPDGLRPAAIAWMATITDSGWSAIAIRRAC